MSLISKTDHGASVELHKAHFDPLLEVVRAAKAEALRRGNIPRSDLFREIEHRLSTASRVAGNTTC